MAPMEAELPDSDSVQFNISPYTFNDLEELNRGDMIRQSNRAVLIHSATDSPTQPNHANEQQNERRRKLINHALRQASIVIAEQNLSGPLIG